MLVVTGGPQDGATLACAGGEQKVLGSAHGADLRLTAAHVAATHAHVTCDGTELTLTDAGGPHGTFVNGEKISGPQTLAEGDRVYLGPPGSTDSVSLLVCPPIEDKGDSFLFAPTPEAEESAPLVLDEPAAAPAFDFLASAPSSPAPAREEPKPAPVVSDEPIKVKPQSPPPPARKPAKPEYSMEMPSIGGDRVREPVRLPPSPSPRPSAGGGRKGSSSSLPLPMIAGGAAALLVVLGGAAWFFLGRGEPPVLGGLNPTKSEPGATVALTGQHFASDAGGNTVYFGDKVGQVVSASEGQISAKVPDDAPIGDVAVRVKTSGGSTEAVTLRLARVPQVSALEPMVALPGSEIVVRGSRLNDAPATVMIGGRTAEVVAAEGSSLRVRVPADIPVLEGKTVPLSVTVAGETAKPANLTLGRLPLVSELAPSMGAPAAKITIRGFGFAANPADNAVLFGDKRAIVLAAKPEELVVAVPGSDRSGAQLSLDVRVQAGGSTSTPRPFILTRASSGTFTPRFYPDVLADHPGHDHVLVASDVGPVLVLTGPANAGTTGQRALSVAEGLNTLIEASVGKGAAGGAVEARDTPEPCLAIVGGACLATVTPADVAAYDEKWGAEKGARASARLVAAHWAALVEDYLLLFVRGQRPYRVVETSPRGKVLLEIYGEAVRKVGSGNGVPTSIVSPLPTKWTGALRDAALILPGTDSSTRRAAAIEGVWMGTAQESGASREIRVQFQLHAGGKTSGSLTTKRGTLSMDVPLTDVVYEKGTVRFVAMLSGQPTTFSGTLQQGAISGTVQTPGRPAGQFSLSFVE